MKVVSTKMKLSLILVMSLVGLLLITSSILAGDLKLLHDKKFAVSDGGTLNLKSAVGDIFVQAGSGSEVNIKVYGNAKAAENLEFFFEKSGETVRVKCEKDGGLFGTAFKNISVQYKITVPKKITLELYTSGGDVKISNLNGKSEVNTSGGDIELENNIGNLSLKTSGGDIEIKNHKGNIYAGTSGGDIKLQSQGNVNCETSGGDIDLIIENGSVSANTSGGDVTLKYWGENKGIELGTSGGDVKCMLPENFKADVELRTFGGEINLNFTKASTSKIKSSRFEGKFNGGGNKLVCKTSGGNIEVTQTK